MTVPFRSKNDQVRAWIELRGGAQEGQGDQAILVLTPSLKLISLPLGDISEGTNSDELARARMRTCAKVGSGRFKGQSVWWQKGGGGGGQ